MTETQLFKYGFLLACAEHGLNSQNAEELAHAALRQLEKRAFDPIVIPKYLAAIPFFVGAGVGGGGGLLAAKMMDRSIEPNEVRNQELIDVYRMYAADARRRRARRTTAEPSLKTV